MASILLPLPSNLTSSSFHKNSHRILSLVSLKPSSKRKSLNSKSLRIASALAESNSPNSLDQKTQSLLQGLADSLVLPPAYFSQLPNDLRLDLNDAAFDLANGPVIDEALDNPVPKGRCGQELGEMLLNLSQAWEQADTSTSSSIVSKLPSLVLSLPGNAKSALGKRLVSSGRRFQSMGQYGQGELQKVAKAMIDAGRLLSASPVTRTEAKPKEEAKTFKFGSLQVELTPDKAYIGAVISLAFGILSWQLSQGIQSSPESSLQNDNALLLQKSLSGALLALCYSSTVLSGVATVGLILLGLQLKSKE